MTELDDRLWWTSVRPVFLPHARRTTPVTRPIVQRPARLPAKPVARRPVRKTPKPQPPAYPAVEYSETIPDPIGHYVYRLWASDGTPLYIGKTSRRPADRIHAHRSYLWFSRIAHIDVAVCITAQHAAAEELAQIKHWIPVHNRGGLPASLITRSPRLNPQFTHRDIAAGHSAESVA